MLPVAVPGRSHPSPSPCASQGGRQAGKPSKLSLISTIGERRRREGIPPCCGNRRVADASIAAAGWEAGWGDGGDWYSTGKGRKRAPEPSETRQATEAAAAVALVWFGGRGGLGQAKEEEDHEERKEFAMAASGH